MATLLSACVPPFAVGSAGDGGAEAADAARDRVAHDGGDAGNDAERCVPVHVTSLPAHGGAACPADGSACFPGDVTSFSPHWVPPVSGAPHAGACTSSQIAAAYDACYRTGATLMGCDDWAAVNPACTACLVAPSPASYGAIIYAGGYGQMNFAGCIALDEPCNQPCDAAFLADRECELEACTSAGGGCTDASVADIQSCEGTADLTCGCKGYYASQECYLELVSHPSSHPAAGLCDLADVYNFAHFELAFTAVATFMCGP